MKTLKSILVISAILLVSGYTYATGKGPTDPSDVKKSVREKIATAIESADFKGKGLVTLKFGVTDKSNLQILNIESNDKMLSQAVKEALAGTKINFPKGSQGIYQIKVFVNENTELYNYSTVRSQVYSAVENINSDFAESVKVKIRVVNPSTVQVLKAESADKELAGKVKQAIENQEFFVPKKLSGEYSFNISFK